MRNHKDSSLHFIPFRMTIRAQNILQRNVLYLDITPACHLSSHHFIALRMTKRVSGIKASESFSLFVGRADFLSDYINRPADRLSVAGVINPYAFVLMLPVFTYPRKEIMTADDQNVPLF